MAHLFELDAVDLRILDVLQQDARVTNVELAERVGLSPSPCHRRVRIIEEAGLIQRYVALLDRQALGLGLTVFVEVSMEKKTAITAVAFQEEMIRRPEVLECHIMNGEYDFLLRLAMPDVPRLRDFIMNDLLAVPNVAKTRSNFSLGEVKYTTALPLGTLPRGA